MHEDVVRKVYTLYIRKCGKVVKTVFLTRALNSVPSQSERVFPEAHNAVSFFAVKVR